MFKIKLFLSINLLLSALFCYTALAADDGDFQWWDTSTISWRLNKDWKGALEEELRFGESAANLYYAHTDLGFTTSGIVLGSEFGYDFSINYRHIIEQKGDNWKQENVPHFDLNLKCVLLDIPLANRIRFEYKAVDSSDNFWRFRNKFTMRIPFKLTTFEIQPYIADEIFYDFNLEIMNKNRLYTGLAFKISDKFKSEIYYLYQSSQGIDDKWDDINAFGTKMKYTF